MKHAILLQLLDRLKQGGERLDVLDTHAGAGVYDLQDRPSQTSGRVSGEAAAGVGRLLAAQAPPAPLQALSDAVRRFNPAGALRLYPGSPALTVGVLDSGDSYLGCELRADDHALLSDQLRPLARDRGVAARALKRDGYTEAKAFLRSGRRGLLLVDPPFEAAGEAGRILEVVAGLAETPGVAAAVWLPLKDLESFDGILRGVEAIRLQRALVAEVRLRPLADPMRMNGSAMLLANTPDLAPEAETICSWTARALGEPGALGRAYTL